jgi:type IV pilus assembly protein PilC
MPTFRYQAQTKDGKMVNSTIDAMNLNVAIDTLTASKLKIIEIKPVKFNPFAFLGRGQRKADRQAVVMMTRRLGTMLRSGLQIARAVQVLHDQEEDPGLKPILNTVLHDIRTGSTLSWSIAKHPNAFDSIYISMVKIGETTGDMSTMTERLADFLEQDLKIRKQAKAAMTYPMFIFGVCLIVIAIIFLYILPQMLDIFAGDQSRLPLPTKIMMFICNNARNPYVQLGLVLGIIYYGIYIRDYLKTPEGKFNFDRLKLKLPGIGNLNRKLITAHFCRAMGILLGTGVPLMKALEVLMDFIDNDYFRQLICEPMFEGVREGKNISQVVAEVDFFPMMTTNMISVGESTGELPRMLMRISEFYDQEVTYALESFLVLLEPIMIGTMGLIVCFVLLSVFLPLYQFIMNVG